MKGAMEELATILSNYIFPVGVSIYLLTKLEKRISALEVAIVDLSSKTAISNERLIEAVTYLKEEIKEGYGNKPNK